MLYTLLKELPIKKKKKRGGPSEIKNDRKKETNSKSQAGQAGNNNPQ